MKRTTTFITLLTAAGLALAGCTVKDVDQAPLAGPSTFAHSIRMSASKDTLSQNGSDFTDITITSLSPTGQSESVRLSAQVVVDGIAMDFGTLSTKSPITPTTVRYTAPAASLLAVQSPTTVSIVVTPIDSDFQGGQTQTRSIELQVIPVGVILPTNPTLAPSFTVNPASPQAFQTVTFDASASTYNGTACLQLCSYTWNFGDGTTGTGLTSSKQYRVFGNMVVTLTLTDSRGAQAGVAQVVTVVAPTPPVGVIDVTPTSPVVGQDIFFSGSRTTSPTGRAIVSYDWTFGDGTGASGVTTSHRYTTQGAYTVTLKVTNDVGAVHTATTNVTVVPGGPTVAFTFLPSSPRVGQTVTVNITATPNGASTIRTYTINWGEGTVETGNVPTQSHVYTSTGQFVITVTATDSLGHSRTVTQSVTIAP